MKYIHCPVNQERVSNTTPLTITALDESPNQQCAYFSGDYGKSCSVFIA